MLMLNTSDNPKTFFPFFFVLPRHWFVRLLLRLFPHHHWHRWYRKIHRRCPLFRDQYSSQRRNTRRKEQFGLRMHWWCVRTLENVCCHLSKLFVLELINFIITSLFTVNHIELNQITKTVDLLQTTWFVINTGPIDLIERKWRIIRLTTFDRLQIDIDRLLMIEIVDNRNCTIQRTFLKYPTTGN